MFLYIAIQSIYTPTVEWIPTSQYGYFPGIAHKITTPMEVVGATKWLVKATYVNTKNSQMASISTVIALTSKYNLKYNTLLKLKTKLMQSLSLFTQCLYYITYC